MDPLASLLASMALLGSVFFFVPQGTNHASFAEGELFLSPAASSYDRGWTTGYYALEHTEFGDGDMLAMNIAKGFSIRRLPLSSARILELGGHAGAYNQLLRRDDEWLLLNTDHLAGMNLGYLTGRHVFKLIWEYERHQAQPDYLNTRVPSREDADLLAGDSLQLLFGDLRRRFRYYIVYGEFQHLAPRLRPGFSRFGLDYRSGRGSMHLILAAEQQSYAYNNWAVTNRFRLGLESSQTPMEGWRILWEWSRGKSDYGPYYDADARLSGLRFQRIF